MIFTSITRPTIISPISGLYLQHHGPLLVSFEIQRQTIIWKFKAMALQKPGSQSANIDELIYTLNHPTNSCNQLAVKISSPVPSLSNQSKLTNNNVYYPKLDRRKNLWNAKIITNNKYNQTNITNNKSLHWGLVLNSQIQLPSISTTGNEEIILWVCVFAKDVLYIHVYIERNIKKVTLEHHLGSWREWYPQRWQKH